MKKKLALGTLLKTKKNRTISIGKDRNIKLMLSFEMQLLLILLMDVLFIICLTADNYNITLYNI